MLFTREVTGLQAEAARILPEKALTPKERDSLLKLIIGMAVGGYGFDPKAGRSTQMKQICDDVISTGLSLDEDTVRKWVREAAGLLPTDVPEKR
jgi:hypothetical protein